MGQAGGTLALSIGGRLIGGLIGGPIGAAVGGMAGGLIGSLLFNRSQKPLIPDYQLASSSYGHPIPIIYGQERLAATVIWETKIETKTHGLGGKGFGGGSGTSYHQSAAFAFCQGPAKLLKIWLDGNLFYDLTSTNPQELTKFPFAIRSYTGTEDQLPDPLIEAWVAANATPPLSCPAYRGLCYVVFQEIDLAHFGNRMPNVTALWSTDTTEAIIFQRLNRWSAAEDVSTVHDILNTYGNGVAIDWQRWFVYQLSTDGTIRVFDMVSGLCVLAKTYAQQWSPVPVPANGQVPQAIACCQGSNLYVATTRPFTGHGYSDQLILTLDPNSLNVTNEVIVQPMPGLGDFFVIAAPITLVSALGAVDLLVCETLLRRIFIVDPSTGANSGALPITYGGILAVNKSCPGMVDQAAGTAEVWIFSSEIGSDVTHIFKVLLNGDPSGIVAGGWITEEATLTYTDWGIAKPFGYYPNLQIVYDATDDTFIITNTLLGGTIKWSVATGVVWAVAQNLLSTATLSNAPKYYFTADAGSVGDSQFASNSFFVTDALTGSFSIAPNPTPPTDHNPQGGVFASNSAALAVVYTPPDLGSGDLWVAYLNRNTGNEVSVAAIILDLCERVGMTTDMVDVSLVTDTTIGYVVPDLKAAGQAVADLCHTYQIDMVESDYKLKFVPKGQASVAAITQDDLAPTDAQNMAHFWEAKRAQEQELPLQINVRHNDPSLDFQANATYAKRTALPVPTTNSKRIKTIDLPVVSTNEEARHIAEKWLYTMWAERDTYKTKLGWKYAYLDPTDTVTVTLDNGDSYVVRIESTSIGADLAIDVELASEDATTYADSTSPGALVSFAQQTLAPAAFVDLFQFNVPLLQDGDDLGGTQSRIYFAAAPANGIASSAAATLFKSVDGVTWSNFDTATGFVNWGRATNALADTPAKFATDYLNTVTVNMARGSTTPASCTYTEMMSGANAALLGQEIIQFQNVVSNDDGSITLTTIVRGRRGTEWATSTHTPGEPFILLELGAVSAARLELAELSTSELYKLVPLNSVLDAVPTDAFTYRGYDMFPYAPVNFERTPEHSPTDLVLAWKRRTRIGGWMVDGSDTAPLNESTEAYEAYVLADTSSIDSFDPTNAATYVRKFSGLTSATTTYTASEMATDGFDPSADTLYLAVYQLSAVTGRGFRGYQALPAF